MIAVGHANRPQLANLHYYDVTYAISNRYFAKKIQKYKCKYAEINSRKHDLARSCFQLWPIFGDGGVTNFEKISGKAIVKTDTLSPTI